jgi:hypothetical protein
MMSDTGFAVTAVLCSLRVKQVIIAYGSGRDGPRSGNFYAPHP